MPKGYATDQPTVNAMMVFTIIEQCELNGVEPNTFNYYRISEDRDGETRYRVDCGDIGSFEVGELEGEEEYCTVRKDWIYVTGIVHHYRSLSDTMGGYPRLDIQEAYNHITKQNQRPRP
jgi:hypothetical protein